MVPICVVTTLRILDPDKTVVAPVDYQGILEMESTRGQLLKPYLWRQHSSANSSLRQRRCRALSCWRALPVLLMALLLPKWMQLLASTVAADILINLFVLHQVCLDSATNALLQIQARLQGAGGPAGRRQEQSSFTSYVLRRTSMYEYVPSQTGQKSAVKVCTSMYSAYTSIYFSEKFILRYTDIY